MQQTTEPQPPTRAARALWGVLRKATEARGLRYLFAPVWMLLSVPRWMLFASFLLLVASVVYKWILVDGTGAADVPDGLLVGTAISKQINIVVDWMVVNWDPFFRAINIGLLRYLLLPLEKWLLLMPWWLVVAVVGIAGYAIVGRVFAAVSVVMMLVLAVLGLFDSALMTLAIVITASLLSVGLGIPTGILASKSNQFDAVLRPVLDAMQTMPSFVYLIPVLMLFGLGKVPAVIAVVIYSVPPIIRLTNLGIRQVDANVVEAGRAFGSTSSQLLVKIQFPLALPTIMAGLNQTIMMALAMVVIASMIGAKGLGIEVLNGIARLDIGRGLLGGVGIVIMAVILDRITQGLAKSKRLARTSE